MAHHNEQMQQLVEADMEAMQVPAVPPLWVHPGADRIALAQHGPDQALACSQR